MMTQLHFLRPWWFVTIIPVGLLLSIYKQRQSSVDSWKAICDPHLLTTLIQYSKGVMAPWTVIWLGLSFFWIILSLTGPCWSKYTVPSYTAMQPHVIVLDMSDAMLSQELLPDKLARAKFKIHTLLSAKIGQWGLVAFTQEPFVISPLTQDTNTIDALLSSLKPDIMPVGGYRLDMALEEAAKLIKQSGFNHGQLLVLSAQSPNIEALAIAKKLSQHGYKILVMPIIAPNQNDTAFAELAAAGQGGIMALDDDKIDSQQWLDSIGLTQDYRLSAQDQVPIWRDEGGWLLLPALLCLLPMFRRGRL